MNKEIFSRNLDRVSAYFESLRKKEDLLEEVFSDCSIIINHGVDELIESAVDLGMVLFPKLSKDTVKEDIDWYLFEVDSLENPVVTINDREFVINNSSDLYDMLEFQNNLES